MPISKSDKPTVCLTIGDPSGIGPEVLLKSLKDPRLKKSANFLIIADSVAITKTASACKIHLPIKTISSVNQMDFGAWPINLLDTRSLPENKFEFGKTNKIYGRSSMAYIKKALNLIRQKKADALVTGPISKEAVNLAGYHIQGHTEFLAGSTNTKRFAMMLAAGPLRVVLVTTHIALRDAIKSLNPKKIYESIVLTAGWLKRYFKIKNPKIAVCALNPHAGEAGLFGNEEKKVIMPAVKKAKNINKIRTCGPLPADSVFYAARQEEFDAIICMYHDQGLIPLKMIGRDNAVNVTLGLPFIRTSPAHGTAFDIAGKNKANPNSMKEAIRLAAYLAKTKR